MNVEVQSLLNKFEEFKLHLEEMKINVAALTEARRIEHIDNCEIDIDWYNIIRCNSESRSIESIVCDTKKAFACTNIVNTTTTSERENIMDN